ncbi:hypothetical protein NM688_g899 [Phlebia brevispora]|uniref:Uncharacterized protein n=1 Tax=Phlebia brevispora TaxID=194682 RepID=A0ACC1TCW2_9APHY|nr:hypothetical protein NM688_g899 [Phlebia brevispora]
MITPRFSCSQTEQRVVVSVYCPSVRASDVEIHVDDTLFTLYINPYYLRLNFSHALLEDDESSARYDPSSGYLTVTLTKAVPSQTFEDLDLLAKLLAPRPSEHVPQGPMIEVLDSEESPVSAEDDLVSRTQNLSLDRQDILEAAENDWQIKQEIAEPSSTFKIHAEEHYGFLSLYTGYFRHVQHTENEVNELGADAETCPPAERRQRRIKHEEEKWDEEYYMADYVDNEYIQELIRWRHPYSDLPQDFPYSEQENLAMLKLPRREYLATPGQTHNLYLTLLTLLFSYAYDSRTMQHEPTPESGWTISTLTPAFSALDPPPYAPSNGGDTNTFTPPEVAVTFVPSYRRALSFPLYRSFALAEKCRSDVASFLAGGKRVVFRCLLELKDILDHHDVYYIYSKIWVDDFCLWIQAYASDEILRSLASIVAAVRMEKRSVGWDLEGLEALTRDTSDRTTDSDDESEAEVERMIPLS